MYNRKSLTGFLKSINTVAQGIKVYCHSVLFVAWWIPQIMRLVEERWAFLCNHTLLVASFKSDHSATIQNTITKEQHPNTCCQWLTFMNKKKARHSMVECVILIHVRLCCYSKVIENCRVVIEVCRFQVNRSACMLCDWKHGCQVNWFHLIGNFFNTKKTLATAYLHICNRPARM